MGDRWWVIHEDEIRRALIRVGEGEDAELVFLELWANTEAGLDAEE